MSDSAAAKKVIAIDFDDVLMEFNAGFLEFHNRVHGTTLTYSQLINYDNWEVVYGCDKETMTERAKYFYRSPEHQLVKPIMGAIEAIEKLSRSHSLQIVTSRPTSVREHTLEWLDRHFPELFHDFHFTNIYAGEAGTKPRSKSEVCREIDAAVLIDDAMRHAREVAAAGIPVLLPDRPWNQDPVPHGVTRVHHWSDIIDWIENNLEDNKDTGTR